MIGLAAGHGSRVRQPASAKGGSIELDVDTVTRRVTAVTLVSGARPVTALFYNGSGVLLHTIAHPANATTTYNVTAHAIPVAELAITRPDASTKYVLRPEYAVRW